MDLLKLLVVLVVNGVLSSPYYSQPTSTQMSGPPSTLTRLSSIGTDFDIVFSWNVTDYDQNSRFTIYRNGMLIQNNIAIQQYSDDQIQAAVDYAYTVASSNIYIASTTPNSTASTFHSGPGAPTQPLLVEATTSTIAFEWSAPAFVNIKTTIIGYNLLRNEVYLTFVNNTIYNDTAGLKPGTLYEYSVQAVVTDETNAIYNGILNNGFIKTTGGASSHNNNANNQGGIIGAAVGSIVGFIAVGIVIGIIYKKLRVVKNDLDDIKIGDAEQASQMSNFGTPSQITVTPEPDGKL